MEAHNMFGQAREAYRAKHGKSPRVLDGGADCTCETIAMDEPGAGGACHKYIMTAGPDYMGYVKFQEGPIEECGINGCQNENLLSIVLDRLECFQAGEYACTENACALDSVRGALTWLKCRTAERAERGVEGTSEK